MNNRPIRALLAWTLLVAALASGSAAATISQADRQSFIVVLEANTQDVANVARDLAARNNGELGYIYQNALKGFSITMSSASAQALTRNPQVAYVEADVERSIEAQEIPTGIERAFATVNSNISIDGSDDVRVDVDVAVIDTGVDFEHPDLNVVGGVDCSGGGPFGGSCSAGGDDNHYHGTHVAGTVGAIDNGDGVVGVAPGARIWAVKVLDSRGSGYTSWIVAGIDWVAANSDVIEVANMSLGGGGFSQAEYDAIQGAVNNGVAFAVSAGNDGADANNYSPAAFDNALTVSALADFDGTPGGLGSPTCRADQDDTLADFSNWGSAVDIAAPGVCILSTYPIEQGSYGTISGTSMASPHVAGALALLASSNNPGNASDVQGLYNTVIASGNFNWADDSGDGILEPLLDVSSLSIFAPTLVPGGGGTGNSAPIASLAVSCAELVCTASGADSSDDGTIVSYGWDFGDGSTAIGTNVSHTYSASGTYTMTLVVTDDDGATGSDSQSVTVSDGSDPIDGLSGTSVSNGRTWTAVVVLTGSAGSSTSGTWSTGASGGCTIASDATSCEFSLSGIAKRVGSVTYTDAANSLAITIIK